MAAAAAASAGDEANEDDERRAREARRVSFVRFLLPESFSWACLAGSVFDFSASSIRAIAIAPAAAIAFSATPTQVVPLRPSAGINQKPAAIAPAAAPQVFAAYNTPAEMDCAAAIATGNVAPIAAAGRPTRIRLMATRTNAKRVCASPSAYAQARAGTVARRAKGRSKAMTATTISSAA